MFFVVVCGFYKAMTTHFTFRQLNPLYDVCIFYLPYNYVLLYIVGVILPIHELRIKYFKALVRFLSVMNTLVNP